jgi:hypothetical protein
MLIMEGMDFAFLSGSGGGIRQLEVVVVASG